MHLSCFWCSEHRSGCEDQERRPSLVVRQSAKKVVSDIPGLVDFAIGLVNSVIKLLLKVKCFEEFKLQKNCEINLPIKTFLRLVEKLMIFVLVKVSFSLPEWQAVKITFFASCYGTRDLRR